MGETGFQALMKLARYYTARYRKPMEDATGNTVRISPAGARH